MIQRSLHLPVVMFLLSACMMAVACLGADRSGHSGAITPSELAERVRSGTAPFILDVRTPQEYSAGHIPGAINIPHSELADRLVELKVSKSDEIVVHCQRGPRSKIAERILTDAGYANVRDLEGDMEAWLEGAHPTE